MKFMKFRRKSIYIIISFMAISLMSFTSDAITYDNFYFKYGIGFKANEELIWNCHVCDFNKMNDAFGYNWDDNSLFESLGQGKRMKWQINEIQREYNTSTYLRTLHANINVWNWNNDENWGFYDYDIDFTYLDNPNLYPNNYNLSNSIPFIPFWFPVPVGEYLGSLKLSSIYDVDNRVLPTLNVVLNKDFLQPNHPPERILIIAIYNANGILNSLKLYTSGNIVILDIELESLPIYVIPATIGLIGAFFIAIILYVKKQRNIKSNDKNRIEKHQ